MGKEGGEKKSQLCYFGKKKQENFGFSFNRAFLGVVFFIPFKFFPK